MSVVISSSPGSLCIRELSIKSPVMYQNLFLSKQILYFQSQEKLESLLIRKFIDL